MAGFGQELELVLDGTILGFYQTSVFWFPTPIP